MYILLDAGHGGLVNGKYVTAGKRSPKWEDLPQLFEGVQNRRIVARIKEKLSLRKIPFQDVVNSDNDIPLAGRVHKANEAYALNKSAIYVSIHADAMGDGLTHHDANGFSVWTSKGETKSDLLAEAVLIGLSASIKDRSKFRKDAADGDNDYEADFYVLHNTKCPAILCELGFMTNRQECEKMLQDEWVEQCAEGIVNGIVTFYTK